MRVDWPDWSDERYRKLIIWLANEYVILEKALGHKPTSAELRAHAHAFIDIVFDDDEECEAVLVASFWPEVIGPPRAP